MKPSLWRKFPRWAIAVGIVTGSTLLFAFWWFFLYPRWGGGGNTSSPSASSSSTPDVAEPDEWEKRHGKAATLPSRVAGLVVAGNDLYDVLGGELVFPNWLQGGCPPAIYYDAKNQRIIGKVERGLIRFELTGKKEKVMGEPFGAAFSDGHRLAVFARDGDIWKAVPDWNSFSLTKEMQVTKLGEFRESFLVPNIMMGTENMIVVRKPPNLLQVDMNTGEVHPLKLPPGSSFENQSPDGRMLVGMIRERSGANFYAYDVEKDEVKTLPLGRNMAINGVLWLDNDRCAVLVAGRLIQIYDHKEGKLSELVSLPAPGQGLLGPSPSGRRFWAMNARGDLMLVDAKEKEVERFEHPADSFEWAGDDGFIYACSRPDTSVRGTFYMPVGGEPRRLTDEPFLASRDSRSCSVLLEEAGVMVFGTKSALFRVGIDGTNLKEILPWANPSSVLQRVEVWNGGK